MTRREFLRVTVTCAVTSGVLAACGLQAPGGTQPKRVPVVGYLSLAPAAASGVADVTDALHDGLRELGYIEGQNVLLDRRYAAADQQRLNGFAAELVTRNVDVLVADGDVSTLAAKRATSTIPIVIVQISDDPVANGLVDNLAHPGGNITGVTNSNTEIVAKDLEFVRQLIPGVAQVGVLWSSEYPPMVSQLKRLESAGPALGIRVQPLEVKRPDDFDGAFQAAASARLLALIITSSQLTAGAGGTRAGQDLLDLALKYRLPTVGRPGATIVGYGADANDSRRRAAKYVDRILKGAKPGDLPIEGPTKFDLVIDLKLARAIGLTVPPALLAQATEVIQ